MGGGKWGGGDLKWKFHNSDMMHYSFWVSLLLEWPGSSWGALVIIDCV